jgi:Ca2+-binding RTX toxin-like protein
MRTKTKLYRIASVVCLALGASLLAVPANAQEERCWGETPTIVGTDDPEEIVGTERRDVIVGRGGRDRIQGLGGDDLICGGDALDRIRGGDGNDHIDGERDVDLTFGGAGEDVLYESQGKTTYRTRLDQMNGGPGADSLEMGRSAGAKLRGGPGDDSLKGYSLSPHTREFNTVGDTGIFLNGGPDDDRLELRSLYPEFTYGVVTFKASPRPVTVDLGQGVATGWGTDTLINIHEVSGSQHDDTISAGDEEAGLYGEGGADTLTGSPNDDDALVGGDGNDRLTDPGGNNYLSGGYDSDVIIDGIGSSDYLDGGPGNDEVHGGEGNDTLHGAERAPDYESGIKFWEEYVHQPDEDLLFGDAGDDVLEDDALVYDDELHGGPGDDVIEEGAGNDLVTGDEGNDEIDARRATSCGHDRDQQNHFDGGEGIDLLDYQSCSGRLYVNLTEGVARGSQGEETIAGIEDIQATSRSGAELIGNDQSNTITTGWGDDVIRGMGGDDILTATSRDQGGAEPDFDRVDGGDGSDVCRQSEETTNCESQ